jgi:hypothetical protein
MKKLGVLGASLLSIAAIPSANAQTWSPNGPVFLNGTSIVVREAGLTYVCNMTGSGTVTGGTFKINTLSLSGPGLCGAPTFFATPYTVVGNIGSIVITGVQFTGIVGFCNGNLNATYQQGTGRIIFTSSWSRLPMSGSAAASCSFEGALMLSPPLTF